MVSEAAAETQAESQTNPGDATNQPADAAEQDVDAFLSPDKEGEKEGTEAGDEKAPEEEPQEVREAREAAAKATEERVERETKERLAKEARDKKAADDAAESKRKFEQGYRDRMAERARLKDELTALGIPAAKAEEIAKREQEAFNSHHADGLKLFQDESDARAITDTLSLVNKGFEEVLGDKLETFLGSKDEPKSYPSMADALSAFKAIVTEGLVTEAEKNAAVKGGILAYRRDLEKKGLIAGTQSGQSVPSEGGSGSDGPSWAQVQKMSPDQVMKLSDEEYRAAMARA